MPKKKPAANAVADTELPICPRCQYPIRCTVSVMGKILCSRCGHLVT